MSDWYGTSQYLKESFYKLDPPNRIRTVPMQILAVGPSRSGTSSLRDALLQLGYPYCYHGWDVVDHQEDDIVWQRLRLKKEKGGRLTAQDFDKVIGHASAIADHPAAAFAPDLIEAYPKAKVILNVRKDVDAWHNSVSKKLMPLHRSWKFWFRSWFCAELFWVQESFFRGNWKKFYRGNFEEHSREVLADHCHMMRAIVPPERLLEWDVHDGWAPLCEFLDHPVPNTPFPSLNSDIKYEQRYNDRVEMADKNIIRFVLVMICVFILWFGIF